MGEVLSYWLNVIYNFINHSFSLMIVSNVSFGWFVIACLVISVVINFLFRKIIK